jgi:hypothetical protein
MKYIYILLVFGLLLSGCYLGKEWLDQYTVGGIENSGNNTPQPLSRGDFTWEEFVASIISLSAGTYLAVRKIRLLLVNACPPEVERRRGKYKR